MRTSIRRGTGAVFAVVLVACSAAAVVGESGCTTRQCVASGAHETVGLMLDPNTYATTQLDDDWLPFNSMETIMVTFPPDVQAAIGGRQPATIDVEVGTDQTPNGFFANGTPAAPDASSDGVQGHFSGGDQFITGSGQLAYLNFFTPGGFWVTNASCETHYFVRVVVTYPAFPPVEAGAPETDAGVSDGSVAAESDGPALSDGGAESGGPAVADAGAD